MNRLAVGWWLLAACAVVCGCATDYSWSSSVPARMRTVFVPTFQNESEIVELGAITTRQLLREIQREGTFKIRNAGEAALEVQGVIKSASAGIQAYDRRVNMQIKSHNFRMTAEVSVIDKRTRRVLINNRVYSAEAVFTARQDRSTAERDASGRLAEDLARQIVDSLLTMDFEEKTK